MNLTIESIKKMLSEITQGKWWYNKENRMVTGRPDNHNIETVSYKTSGETDGEFIAASPEIVRFLLDKVEEQKPIQLSEPMRDSWGRTIREQEELIKELELKFQAARNVASKCLAKSLEINPLSPREIMRLDQEIEAEFQRLKSEGKEKQ